MYSNFLQKTEISIILYISAPGGCIQYFTGVSGQLSSFNFKDANGRMLSNTDYTMCIRTERNFCGIQYSPCLGTVFITISNIF